MQSNKTKDRFSEIESLLRKSNYSNVLDLIKKIPASKLRPLELIRLASFYRRVELPRAALHLLAPLIHDPPTPPSADLIAEYAANLIRMNAYQEAQKRLSQITSQQTPWVLFFQGLLLIHLWDFSKAIGFLLDFLKTPVVQKDLYWDLITHLNLSMCYLHEKKLELAKKSLNHIFLSLKNFPYSTAEIFAWLFQGELLIQEEDFLNAEKTLSQIKPRIQKISGIFSIIHEKHCFLLHAKKHLKQGKPWNELLQKRLRNLQEKAWIQNSFSTFLDLSFYEAKLQKDFEKLLFIFYVSPFPAYQKRVLRFLKAHNVLIPPKQKFIFTTKPFPQILLEKPTKTSLFLQPHHGVFQTSSRTHTLKPGHLIQTLFEVFTSNLLKTIPTGELFEKLFPDQYYHPHYAHLRIRQLIQRGKKFLLKNKLPLSIRHKKSSGYYLEINKPISIEFLSPFEIDPFPMETSSIQKRLWLLFSHFKTHSFTFKQALEVLKVSNRTLFRVFKVGVQKKLLIKNTLKRGTYTFSNAFLKASQEKQSS